jgi:hypothetical protein
MLSERAPVLIDLAEALEWPTPEKIVQDPWAYLEQMDGWFGWQEIPAEDHAWAVARVGYWIGEALAVRFEGEWFLNELPDTRFFLHVVVGRFRQLRNQDAMVAPMDVANQYCKELRGRSLRSIMSLVCRELEAA